MNKADKAAAKYPEVILKGFWADFVAEIKSSGQLPFGYSVTLQRDELKVTWLSSKDVSAMKPVQNSGDSGEK
jgi:hypothetical protein